MQFARYSFGLEGSSHFMRSATEAQEEVLEPFFKDADWQYAPNYFTDLPALYLNRKPTALLNGIEIFGVIVGFIGTYFATKIFDEVYERTLKRPIGEYLDTFFRKVKTPNGMAVEYRDIIYLEDIDLAVVIRAIVTKETTKELQTQVMQAHRIAHTYIETHGREAPIHCHKIVNKQISVDPELFQTLEEVKQHERVKVKPMWRGES